MNILMIHPHDLFSSSEPWTVRIRNMACEFIKRGHSVKLIYFPLDRKDANKRFLHNGIELISLNRSLGAFILLRNIIQIIKLADWSDIIHFQKCYYYVVLPALIAAWINNKPIHYDWDDWETKIFYYSNPKQFVIGEFINIFEKLIPKAVDTVSVSSKHLHKLCIRRGVLSRNIFSAPVGADLQQFRADLNLSWAIKRKYNINNLLVVYLGQLHGGQYAELFIKAASIIIKNRDDVTFMIIGDGYRSRELRELGIRLNVDKYFIFTGSVAHSQIPYYLADADVCVACFEENDITRCKSPLKIVEYLACGKAIVASNVGETRDMLGGVGMLTEPGNVNSLANGIIALLENERLREEMGKLARERAERKYNWTVTADNLLNAYEIAIKTNGKSLRLREKRRQMERVNPVKGAKLGGNFKVLIAKVISVTEHEDKPYTIEVKIERLMSEKDDSLTVDPRCTFYKNDGRPKAIDIVKPGDIIETTYIIHEGIKVALNIIVKPM